MQEDYQKISQVTSGLSPAVGTALGLLTTGALGTVAYGYLANSESDLATSASSYAYVSTFFCKI